MRSLAVAPFNLKVGLTNSCDLEFIAETFVMQKTNDRDAGTRQTMSGFGHVSVRWKVNLWGNDGLGNDAVEGGVIFPLEIKLAKDWDLGMMTEVDWRQNSNGSASGSTSA